jgi:DNA (cytosine-5)-methyltransferase 1
MSKYRDWPEELLADCELLVGGTPCQAFSVAGLRKSLDDERGNLSLIYVQMFHHINAIRRKHGRSPAIALWENVPGVLSTKDNAFGCFISGLLGVDDTIETQDGKWPKAGFLGSETVRVGYRVLDAQYFGVAQRRRRVFLVAVPCELVSSLGERACPSEILSLRESVLGNPPSRGEAWEGVARSTAASLTSSGRGVERCGESRGQDDVVLHAMRESGPGFWMKDDITGTLRAEGEDRPSRPSCVVAFHPTQDPISSVDGSTHAMGCGSKGGCCTQAVAFSHSAAANSHGVAYVEEGTPPLRGGGAGNSMPAVAFNAYQRTEGQATWPLGASDGRKVEVGVRQAMAVRRLTPRECERLQGFPDDYTLVTYRNKPAADGPRYKALGNSMAVPCMFWLGYRIHKATE